MNRLRNYFSREQSCYFAGVCTGLGMHDLFTWEYPGVYVGILFVGIGAAWRFLLIASEKKELKRDA